jgi:hypothetical protein
MLKEMRKFAKSAPASKPMLASKAVKTVINKTPYNQGLKTGLTKTKFNVSQATRAGMRQTDIAGKKGQLGKGWK